MSAAMGGTLMLDTNAVSALVKGRVDSLGALLNQREFCISVTPKPNYVLAWRGAR